MLDVELCNDVLINMKDQNEVVGSDTRGFMRSAGDMIHESDLADGLIFKLNPTPRPLSVGILVANREHLQYFFQRITYRYVSWVRDTGAGDLQ